LVIRVAHVHVHEFELMYMFVYAERPCATFYQKINSFRLQGKKLGRPKTFSGFFLVVFLMYNVLWSVVLFVCP